jgi:hypothetical protein
MARRFEAVEGRTRSLVTLAGSVTFAAIAFVKSIAGEHRIGSPWLLAAALTFVLIIVLAVVATWTARVRAYSPTKVLDYLTYEGWEFKKNVLYWASDDFEPRALSKDDLLVWNRRFMVAVNRVVG